MAHDNCTEEIVDVFVTKQEGKLSFTTQNMSDKNFALSSLGTDEDVTYAAGDELPDGTVAAASTTVRAVKAGKKLLNKEGLKYVAAKCTNGRRLVVEFPSVIVTPSGDKQPQTKEAMKEYDAGGGGIMSRLFGSEKNPPQPFKLPTSEQWEYAARGGLERADYPWGDGSMFNEKDNLLANFKPRSGNYTVDGGMYTTKVKSYLPNDFELYDMAGNVSEWTEDSYDISSSYFGTSLNSSSDEERGSLKEVRGGSWKDVKKYLKVWEVDYEYKDTARSYIGFRTVQASPQIKRKK